MGAGVINNRLAEYRAFIASRAITAQRHGFDPMPINTHAKAHQKAVLDFALNKGRSAAFLDTGLGKSFIELEFARQCAEETGKPSLILTPLAVAGQMVREGAKFGIEARQIKDQSEVGSGVMVANYERLAKLDPAAFGAVVLDESSILKSYAGKTRATIQAAFEDTQYKLTATATPSPNDHTELGNHAEFMGVMRQQEMLSKWFINDTATASQEWRLKGHAQEDFWRWVASWARCATLPSDLGGDDAGYVLPEIDRRIHEVAADRQENVAQGMLFRIPEMSATSFHAEKRLTLDARIKMVVEIVDGCLGNLNTPKPASAAPKLIPNIVQSETPKETDLTPKPKQNTCVATTNGTAASGSAAPKRKKKSTPAAESDTSLILNLQSNADSLHDQEIRRKSETDASNQHTGSTAKLTTKCCTIRVENAQSAESITQTGAADDCTLTTATQPAQCADFSALRAIQPLESCETIPTGCETQSHTSTASKDEPWLIFCESNDEQSALERAFEGRCISVKGSDTADKKEAAIKAWMDGEKPIFISKASIVGYGLNFQHCRNVVFASVSFSYEQHYQAVRRVWRFGQERVVRCHIVISDTEASIWNVINEKSAKHDEMKRRMADAMKSAQTQGARRVVYDRPLDLAFPDWLKTGD